MRPRFRSLFVWPTGFRAAGRLDKHRKKRVAIPLLSHGGYRAVAGTNQGGFRQCQNLFPNAFQGEFKTIENAANRTGKNSVANNRDRRRSAGKVVHNIRYPVNGMAGSLPPCDAQLSNRKTFSLL